MTTKCRHGRSVFENCAGCGDNKKYLLLADVPLVGAVGDCLAALMRHLSVVGGRVEVQDAIDDLILAAHAAGKADGRRELAREQDRACEDNARELARKDAMCRVEEDE